MNNEIMVSVLCAAYNHERYIEKCLESLVSQNTDFNFEIIVHDDASTDNTVQIIKKFKDKYPNKIKAIYQSENQYSKGMGRIAKIMFPLAQGRYIATCEGDDFWTDNMKLQTQYDFMEAHPECVACGHAAYYAEENGELRSGEYFRPYESSKFISFEELLSGWKMATNSLFYKKAVREDIIIPFQGDCKNGDYALIVYLGLKGKIYYDDKFMSAYRVVSRGSLGWVWRNDSKKYVTDRMKYVDMLARLNQYTEGAYETVLNEYKDEVLFDLYLTVGDIPGLKKYKQRYDKLTYFTKFKMYIKYYCPSLIKVYRKIRGQI